MLIASTRSMILPQAELYACGAQFDGTQCKASLSEVCLLNQSDEVFE